MVGLSTGSPGYSKSSWATVFQIGFRAGNEVESDLLSLMNDLWGLTWGVTLMIVLNLSATFETIDHDILLGIGDTFSFLVDFWQCYLEIVALWNRH